MAKKVLLISLGCAKNLVNSEQMLTLLDDAGYELTDDPNGADAAIVNTCGFIDSAKLEAIDRILWLAEFKKQGLLKKIIVAGCFSQRYQDELFKELPEIDALVGTGSYKNIVDVVNALLEEGKKQVSDYGDINAPVDEIVRSVDTSVKWAYIKIAEGCDNRCSYCVIPDLRGKFRSRTIENIVEEAEGLAEMGMKELIVVAQDITRYGIDIYGKRSLAELLERLCEIPGFDWIRLHYLYPDETDDELIDVIANEDKILKYLDIPIQHINDKVLKLMNRRGTGDEIRELFKKLRDRIPGLVLRTSLISGLPGEGEEEFEELCEFLREAKIERAGVFPYSPEEGTPAAEMDRPDEDTANERARILMEIQNDVMDSFNASRIGKVEKVIVEGCTEEDANMYWGRSFAESPDVDGIIMFKLEDESLIENGFVNVRITEDIDGDMFGVVCEEDQ